MRMKNAIDQTRKYKIKYEMKLFLLVLQMKMNKYYNSKKKNFFNKWHKASSRLKKIDQFFSQVGLYENEMNKVALQFAMKNIHEESQDTTFILRFINKYLGNYVMKVKKSL